MTATSDFGVGRREGHDASAFYGRELFHTATKAETTAQATAHCSPFPLPSSDWVNHIYCADARDMHHLPDNSIALAFTSPPYNAGKTYD